MKTVKQGGNMGTMTSEERWAKIDATLDRTTALAEENEKGFKELKTVIGELSKTVAATTKSAEETNKGIAETRKTVEELSKTVAETTKGVDKMYKSICGVKEELGGISASNGMVAEEYFYNTLNETLTFGGYHFDFADRHLKRKRTDKNGKRVEAEYDVLMGNDLAACIMEVKYRARIKNIDELIEKVDKFRIHFPAYANHKIILAIGALSFDEGVEDAAKERGIGIMKQDGDAVVVYDENLKVY